MTIKENMIHRLMIGTLFTIMNYFLVNNLIINISFTKYFLIELILVLSMKLFKFTVNKLDLK
jgi:hypothetical protein